ncbi:hypothetical protein THIOM_004923 [Candidatus Thiomargarita nelsonii]|uniref:Uncharacterized protein n=1 Tax=Candidatus Thiomargarita nelsonii TaxID=1003181 RepID=A0A176RUM3_9GAMM|nr:hypothetical protein THIOM_004923 [Candidatus Thiomargarita nelsonii]
MFTIGILLYPFTHFPEYINETHIGFLHPFDQMLNIRTIIPSSISSRFTRASSVGD